MNAVNALCLLLCGTIAAAADFTVKVEPSEKPLHNAIIRIPVTDTSFPKTGLLTSESESIPFQRTADNQLIFILPSASSAKTFRVKPNSSARSESAKAELENGRVTITTAGKKAFVYQGEESELPRENIKPLFKRGGYIHPVFSPSGKQITDDYPPNHVHHHGIWFPWTKTSFEGRAPDFWNMGGGKGKVEFVKLDTHWSGPVHAGFQATHRFIDLTSGEPKPALNETWTVTAYQISGANVFDLVSTQTCASASPLILPKYHYGGLGFRGNWAWNGQGNCSFLTSNGGTDRIKGNETRGNWCYIGGTVDHQLTGVAILSHPDNFRSPQPMRLHPSEPFFCFAPSQLGDWKIEPGQPYVSKYRFIVSDGPANKEVIDRLWATYAHPPKAVIQKL